MFLKRVLCAKMCETPLRVFGLLMMIIGRKFRTDIMQWCFREFEEFFC